MCQILREEKKAFPFSHDSMMVNSFVFFAQYNSPSSYPQPAPLIHQYFITCSALDSSWQADHPRQDASSRIIHFPLIHIDRIFSFHTENNF
jgi:hypothetical protein